jgi:hypothetical protein
VNRRYLKYNTTTPCPGGVFSNYCEAISMIVSRLSLRQAITSSPALLLKEAQGEEGHLLKSIQAEMIVSSSQLSSSKVIKKLVCPWLILEK